MARKKAASQGRTLQSVVNEHLKPTAAAVAPPGPPYRLELEGWRAEPHPGVNLFDRDQLFDLTDGR